MATFDQWAAPASQRRAQASLYDSGGFDDEPPPPSENAPQGSSFVQSQLRSRAPLIETKNSHLLALENPPAWQTDDGSRRRPLCSLSRRPRLLLIHASCRPAHHHPLVRCTPGTAAPACTTCAIPFDFFIRRHHVSVRPLPRSALPREKCPRPVSPVHHPRSHPFEHTPIVPLQCRLCGLIFCDECTSRRAMVPLAWREKDPQRVCGDCFAALQPIQEEIVEVREGESVCARGPKSRTRTKPREVHVYGLIHSHSRRFPAFLVVISPISLASGQRELAAGQRHRGGRPLAVR